MHTLYLGCVVNFITPFKLYKDKAGQIHSYLSQENPETFGGLSIVLNNDAIYLCVTWLRGHCILWENETGGIPSQVVRRRWYKSELLKVLLCSSSCKFELHHIADGICVW